MTAQEIAPTAEPALKGKELDLALSNISKDKNIDPSTVNRFLQVELKGLSLLDKTAPWILLGGYIVTWAISHGMPESATATLGTIPPAIHWALEAVNNLSSNSAGTQFVRDHLPYIFLAASVGWGAIRTGLGHLRIKEKAGKIQEAKEKVLEKTAKGEFPFTMNQNHSAVFSGTGDPYGDLLEAKKPKGDVIQYGIDTLNSQIWELIKKGGSQEELFKVLDRGDFTKAGEIVLLPVIGEDMFLPGDEGHDMSLDEMRALVSGLDAYCKSRGMDKKRVVIVGRSTMKETYVERKADGNQVVKIQTLDGKNKPEELPKDNILPLKHEMEKERGVETKIIDPTVLVMEKISQLAEGKTVSLFGTQTSIERYGTRFSEALNEVNYKVTNTDDNVRVIYNLSDDPTVMRAEPDDVAVILDPNRKQGLIDLGIPEERIIIVPELVYSVLDSAVEKS